MGSVSHVLLTGAPGCGKTTVVRRVADRLQRVEHIRVAGFYTADIRDNSGQRTGFQVTSLVDGSSAPLATVGGGGERRLGRYAVHLAQFERVAMAAMQTAAACDRDGGVSRVMCIDEIGKMELFSGQFAQAVTQAFSADGRCTVLATIPISRPGGAPIALVEQLRNRHDTHVIHVTAGNRDRLVDQVFQQICDIASR